MSSTELFDAGSILMTSSDDAWAIEPHDSQTPQGSTVGPFTQFRHAARIFAIDVLPVPREPTNRYAWWTLPCSIALLSVRTTCSCPTTSANVRGRWRRYSEAIGTQSRCGPCTLRRGGSPASFALRWLQSSYPAAPAGDRLRLLPSGPDLVHGPTPRGTRPSTPRTAR